MFLGHFVHFMPSSARKCIMEDCHFLLKYCCSNISYSFLRSLKSKKRHLVASSKQLTYLLILK